MLLRHNRVGGRVARTALIVTIGVVGADVLLAAAVIAVWNQVMGK